MSEVETLKSQMEVIKTERDVLKMTVNEILNASVANRTGLMLAQNEANNLRQQIAMLEKELVALKPQEPANPDAPAV